MGSLFGPDLPEPMDFSWIMERVQRCERRIWATASEIVRRGGTAILDPGFMKMSDRARFVSLCASKGLPVQLHFVTAPRELRRARVASRNSNQGDTFAFEVTPAMFDFMERQFEAPTQVELSKAVAFDSRLSAAAVHRRARQFLHSRNRHV